MKDVPSECTGGEIVVDFNSVQKPNPNPNPNPNREAIDEDRFHKMVAERAYCKAEKRGFIGGHEMEDWLEPESEI
jgi:hypothetical protein